MTITKLSITENNSFIFFFSRVELEVCFCTRLLDPEDPGGPGGPGGPGTLGTLSADDNT